MSTLLFLLGGGALLIAAVLGWMWIMCREIDDDHKFGWE